jgi:hypothetical protein
MTTRESWAMLKALQQINTRLAALAIEVTGVRTTLDIQGNRIKRLQAELDAPPVRRLRPAPLRAPAYPRRAADKSGDS